MMGLRKIFSLITMNQRGMSFAIDKKRKILSRELSERMQHTVKYGPFAGMIFCKDSWWGGSDIGAMLLGIYEEEVLNSIMGVTDRYDVFIDLGAADGYYSIGSLVSKKFQTSYSFEISAKGRNVIQKNANLNRVSNKLHIFGEATQNFYKNIPIKDLNSAVILIDIEGAEFFLLNRKLFSHLKKAIFFIELHDWFFEDGNKKIAKLMADAKPFFKISRLTTTSRDLSKFPELLDYPDSERWLIASEGRSKLMTWLRLDPKSS
jgi:hypothetical protein